MASDKTIESFVAKTNAYIVGTTSATLLDTNVNRVKWSCQNTQGVLYIKLGYGCTPQLYSYRLPTSAILEDTFDGPISACVASGTGICFITECV